MIILGSWVLKMKYLINKYKDYQLEYDYINKILTINESISVDDFVKIKIDILSLNIDVKDIRVNA